eukprot:TRINITY_DN690_c0_g1_i4.p1 TRINITY_DN690_c0_g1~~TRINITY_DN690_c0_g1_i4.p1  ORF type:complete len:486 (-),score=81.99 TRINITY_DN690_c0_g1_i4:66-1523(-)
MAAPLSRRATFAAVPFSNSDHIDETPHTEQTPLYDAEATSVGGNSPKSRPGRIQRRETYAFGESMFPNHKATWTIQDDEESMDDVSIVINLLADLSPAGILPLSFGMIGAGYVPALILLLVFASAAAYMMYLVGRTVELSGKKSFDAMWSDLIGPGTAWLPCFVVFLVCFGCCLAYACMFGDLFAGCMPAFGLTFASRTVCLLTLGLFPLLPLCYMKDLSALAPTSFGALVAVIYTIVMMAIRYWDGNYAEGGKYFSDVPAQDGNHMMTLGPKTLLLVNGLAVAFLCHYNGCKYYREFVNHRPDRFGGKILLAFSIVSGIFAAAMLLGYKTFGGLSDGVILNNYSSEDMLANAARVGMGLANVFSFPLMFSGLREQSLALMAFFVPSGRDTYDLVWFQNSLSTVMLTIIIIAALLITDASLVVGLVGSICGSATIYVLPCVLFDRASSIHLSDGKYSYKERVLVRFIAFMGIFLMIAGAVATLTL